MKFSFLYFSVALLFAGEAVAQTVVPNTTYPVSPPTVAVASQAEITTNNNTVTVPSGAQVVYQSGTKISLLPGFQVASGASFTAKIGQDTSSTVLVGSTATSVQAGNSVTFVAAGGTGTNVGYTWSGAFTGTGATQTFTFNTAGTYTVTVTNTATPGQTSTLTINVYSTGYTDPGLKILTPAP
jgi:hypothetical protein